jgi:drug/metabolite transporter (DMT)-like permease
LPPIALLLLFVSAILHTSWNLLLKRSQDKYLASWGTTAVGLLISLPFLFYLGLPPRAIWGLLLASAAVETVYFVSLSYAYRDNDFSLVYPIARGAAPALLFVWVSIFLGEHFTPAGLLGLALIIAGLLLIGFGGLIGNREVRPRWAGIGMALLTALCISVYTAIDGAAVKDADPLQYVLALFMLIPVLLTPLVVRRYGWNGLSQDFRLGWKRYTVMSVLGTLAYALVLLAYQMAPVGYAGAIREMSVVMAALAGWRLLGEGFGPLRLAGSVIVFAGILTIAALG